jgi:hypothetical protein
MSRRHPGDGKTFPTKPGRGMPAPILAFHGTTAVDFERFEFTDDVGFHFGSRECANRRIEQILFGCDENVLEGARILVCNLHVQRPLRLPDCHTWSPQNVLLALREAGVLSETRYDAMSAEGFLDQDLFRDIVEAAGFDCVVYANETEGGGDSYILLRPEQITFALSNQRDLL